MSIISVNYNIPDVENELFYIKQNNGYCRKNKKCICNEFKNSSDNGTCECGVFIKEETNIDG